MGRSASPPEGAADGVRPTGAFVAPPHGPLLTGAQELELARRIERGDAAATRRLIEANLRLVAAVAAEYRGCRVPFADLMQEGCIGLVCAAERFDHRRRLRFSTYAIWWIRQGVFRAIGDARAIRLPDSAQRRLRALHRASSELAAATGREPTLEQAAHAAGCRPQMPPVSSASGACSRSTSRSAAARERWPTHLSRTTPIRTTTATS